MFPLTELPFGLAGQVFRSSMPFARFNDPNGVIFAAYKQAGVQTIVLLTPEDEAIERTGRNLREFYEQNGLQVIHLPIADYSTPSLEELRTAVRQALAQAQSGRNIAVHCYAGIGRTGLFLACMAKTARQLKPSEAINWVRAAIPHAVETPSQMQLVSEF